MQVSLEVHATTPRGDENVTTRLTDVNPDASFATLRSLAQNVNSFTTNTYDHATRIEETIIDGASDKQIPTFSLGGNTEVMTLSYSIFQNYHDFGKGMGVYINYNGDGAIGVKPSDILSSKLHFTFEPYDNNTRTVFTPILINNITYNFPISFDVFASETENFYGAKIHVIITQ